MKYLKSYKTFESSGWTPEEILKELAIEMTDAGLHVDVPNDNKFGGRLYLAIEDKDKVFCKDYPMNDMDWLYGKPIIRDLFTELGHFGFVRDRDYKVYGGGLLVNIVFDDKDIVKLESTIFESEQFDLLKDMFIELSHEGFSVSVKESTSQKLDFSKLDHFGGWNLATKNWTLKTIDVKIERNIIENGSTILMAFNISDVKETLRFAESYAKSEFGLEVEYIYVAKIPNYTYYKSIDVLPDNIEVKSITVAFSKSK